MPLVYIRHSDHSCASVDAVVFQCRRAAVPRPRHRPPVAVLGLRPGQWRWGLQDWDGPQEQMPHPAVGRVGTGPQTPSDPNVGYRKRAAP